MAKLAYTTYADLIMMLMAFMSWFPSMYLLTHNKYFTLVYNCDTKLKNKDDDEICSDTELWYGKFIESCCSNFSEETILECCTSKVDDTIKAVDKNLMRIYICLYILIIIWILVRYCIHHRKLYNKPPFREAEYSMPDRLWKSPNEC